jgi:hypothetical protein
LVLTSYRLLLLPPLLLLLLQVHGAAFPAGGEVSLGWQRGLGCFWFFFLGGGGAK